MGFEVTNEHDKSVMLWKAELNQLDNDLRAKDAIEARAYDLYRNNDLMRGLVEKQVDSVVGSKVVLQLLPDHNALGVTRTEASQWAKEVERMFHAYADSPENWITSNRSMDFTQLCRAAERNKIFTGEITASREWRGSPMGFNTCFNLFSSNRIKSPSGPSDGKIFHGIEFDRFSAATAYHIEEAQLGQKRSFSRKTTKRVAKYNRFGWQQVFHIYEPFINEYPRGISRLACVLKKMKQLDRYHEADLDKAIITTNYVFAITSDEDPESVADMLSGASSAAKSNFSVGTDQELPPEIEAKRQELLEQITARYIETTGGQIAHLFKGEDMKTVAPPNTIQTSENFADGHTRSVANGVGMSFEMGTGNFKGLSFSGGQMSLGIYEHSADIERKVYLHKFAKHIVRSWMDEAIAKGRIPLLGGKEYWKNREAYTRCKFTGAKRVHVDPVKDAKSNQIKLQNGTTSRIDIVNENGGDMESITVNRATEAELILEAVEDVAKRKGIDLSEKDKLKIITDVVTTKDVTIQDVVVEGSE